MYGRGRGVHSPYAFGLVNTLLRPYGNYYDFCLHPTHFRTDISRLVYRIVARCGIECLSIGPALSKYVNVAKMASHSLNTTEIGEASTGSRLYIIDQMDCIESITLCEGSMILVCGAERDKRLFNWVKSIENALVLDLYEAVIIVYMPNVKYLYRTTM